VGGATDPGAAALSPEELTSLVDNEVAPLMKIRQDTTAEEGEPRPHKFRGSFSHVKFYPRALPQYNLGHGHIVEAIRNAERASPGLFFAGNYLEGPAVGKCVENGFQTAKAVSKYLQTAR